MKTIITLLTTTMLAVGATAAITSASAAPQGSDEAAGYALSVQAARGGAQNFGAYASAREPGQIRNSTVPTTHDFQLDGR